MADAQPAFLKLAAATQGLPEVVDGTSYGYPSFMVRKKFLCRVKDADTVVVMCPPAEKEMLMVAAPDIYFETPLKGLAGRLSWFESTTWMPPNCVTACAGPG